MAMSKKDEKITCKCPETEAVAEAESASEIEAQAEAETEACCSDRKKQRSPEEYKDLMNRLNRIEGQVRGIKKMVENDVYCPDILIQVSAVNAALNSFSKELLGNHIRTCVAEDIRSGNDEAIEELVGVLQKMMK